MVEFFGLRITEQELEQTYKIAVDGIGRCEILMEYADDVDARMFALAARDAFLTMAKCCVDLLS